MERATVCLISMTASIAAMWLQEILQRARLCGLDLLMFRWYLVGLEVLLACWRPPSHHIHEVFALGWGRVVEAKTVVSVYVHSSDDEYRDVCEIW
jgi:hypothetical protein